MLVGGLDGGLRGGGRALRRSRGIGVVGGGCGGPF